MLVSSNKRYAPLIGGEMLVCSIRALMSAKAPDDQQSVINLITEIVVKFGHLDDVSRKVLKQLPNTDDKKVKQLVKQLTSTTSEKSQRQTMKKFLQPISGSQSGVFKKAQTVLKVPNMAQTNQQNNMPNTAFRAFIDDTTVLTDVKNLFQ